MQAGMQHSHNTHRAAAPRGLELNRSSWMDRNHAEHSDSEINIIIYLILYIVYLVCKVNVLEHQNDLHAVNAPKGK